MARRLHFLIQFIRSHSHWFLQVISCILSLTKLLLVILTVFLNNHQSSIMSGTVHTRVEVYRMDLWNDLGFSLYVVPSVCCMVATSDNRKKSKIEVSTDWCVTVEYWRLSLIRVIFVNYQTSKLQCNY